MTPDGAGRSSAVIRRLGGIPSSVEIILLLVALAMATTLITYARSYFFLFDDFALVGRAKSHDVGQIVSQALFGFYRPLVFVAVRMEAGAFGWANPAGYMAVSQLLHAANAVLVFMLVRALGQPRRAAAIAATCFALSPWSTEAYLWLSARFDVLSTFGALACLVCSLWAHQGSTLKRVVMWGGCAVLAALVAVFSKENAVVLPLLCLIALCAAPGRGRWLRTWSLAAAVGAASACYLLVRGAVVPGLGGAYGSVGSLFAHADLVRNGLSFVRAIVTIPFPNVPPGQPPWLVVEVLLWLTLAAIAVSATRASARLVALCAAAFAVSIAPMAWTAMPIGTSAAGRFMYLPGLWPCVLMGIGLAHLGRFATTSDERRPTWPAALGTATVAVLLLLGLVSVRRQATTWSRATMLARTSIEQFRPLLSKRIPRVFVLNLPFWFSEGPYVLKDYAFSEYFAGASVPTVRARNMVLSNPDGQLQFAGWVDPAVAAKLVPEAGEYLLRLRLPISSIPPAARVVPEQLSVFATSDGARQSASTFLLEAPDADGWRVEVSTPDLFDVRPASGTGSAELRVVPRPIGGTRDVMATITIRGTQDGEVVATEIVRFKSVESAGTALPFGSVDEPPDPVHATGDVVFRGWALDDFDLRRVSAEATDAKGRRVNLGDATRNGYRPDVAAAYPDGHDLYRAAWVLTVSQTQLSSLGRPATITFFAQDGQGQRAIIGRRTVR